MESDKWIRKLFALLVEMGFELQSAQRHRKVIYKGDKLKNLAALSSNHMPKKAANEIS